MPQRQIFAVFLRAELLAAVMIEMGVISERGKQQRDPADQIPYHAKTAERTAAEMDDFVDEQRRAIQKQAGNNEERDLLKRPGRHPPHQTEADQADSDRHEKIGPINPRI